MTDAELSIQRVEIRRMPGFADGGFTVGDLSPGVNIIYGPNASGKTTLSKAIQTLLRPQDADPQQRCLLGRLAIRGQSWTVEYDVGRIRCRCEGAEADLPPLAPAEVKDHYVLALHDLIGSQDGRDLAAEIVRQSSGGYDIAEARRELQFRDVPSRKGKATAALDAAAGARREAMRRQDALVEEDRRLAALRVRRDDARAAVARLDALEKAIRHHDAAARHREAIERLGTFPSGLARMQGDEVARLEKLDASIQSGGNDRRDEERLHQASLERLAACGLPDEGVAPELLAALRQKCQRLRSLAGDLPKRRQEAERAAARSREARESLGGTIDTAQTGQAARLDAATVARLADHARRVEKLRAEAAAEQALRQWLGPDPQAQSETPETLGEGVRLLSRWVAESERPGADGSRWRLALGLAAAGVLVVSLLMAVLAHGSWLLLLPVAVGLAAWALVPRGRTDRGLELRREFEGLGLQQPVDWTPAEARACAHRLQQRAAEASLCRERSARWGDLGARLDDLARRREEAAHETQELAGQLGIGLEGAETDETWLYAVAAALQRFQEAQETAAETAASLESATGDCQELLAEVGAAVGPYGFEGADDPELAAEQVEQLARRQQEFDTARREIDSHARALDRIDQSLAELAAQRATLLERLGLAEGDEPTLREWAKVHPEYREAAEAARFAERDVIGARAALAERAELAAAAREPLENELEECRVRAAELEGLTQQIGQIEGSIQQAKESTALEAAIADEEQCADALRQQREVDYGAVVGHVLADLLARRERDRQRPAVFKEARRLFVDITHGRYRLDIEPGDPPGFRAVDTHDQQRLALDELSSGTRLQLLLSVRVAFVQRQEQGLKLPLILDETLGNSDERRAGEIIDAAIQICRGGRQVFYLTAQHDEVGKWRAMLRHHADVPCRLVDLAEIRQFSEAERVPPMEIAPLPVPELPPPGDLDWLAYARLLGVPPLDPRGLSGGIHLAYLVDEPPTLHRLLRGGINRWGQLQALAEYGDHPSLRAESPVYRRAEAAARLVEAASRLWRVGRGRPVDRQTLDACPAVTATFLDRVADLAAEVGGDAKRLVARLETGHVKGFRTDKRKELEEHLAEQGYLDPREPLSLEQLREQVRPLVYSDLDGGLLSPQRLEQLLSMVCGA